MFVSGIYALINKVTGTRYIGQGIKVSARIAQQLSDLRCGRAKNKPMLEAYHQVGAENFAVEVSGGGWGCGPLLTVLAVVGVLFATLAVLLVAVVGA